jgi:hypothetical protein
MLIFAIVDEHNIPSSDLWPASAVTQNRPMVVT